MRVKVVICLGLSLMALQAFAQDGLHWNFFLTDHELVEQEKNYTDDSTKLYDWITKSYDQGRRGRFIVYDLRLKDPYMIRYSKDSMGYRIQSKLNTGVRKPTGIIVMNMNPSIHSIEVQREYYTNDKFKISEGLSTALGISSDKNAEDDGEAADGGTGDSMGFKDIGDDGDDDQAKLDFWNEFFDQLNGQMAAYQDRMQKNMHWTEKDYQANWDHLNEVIYQTVGAAYTGMNLKEAVKEHMASVSLSGDEYDQFYKKVDKAAKMLDQLANTKTFQVFDATAPGNYDEVHYKLEIKEGDKVVRNGDQPIKVRINGGLKIDGSAGLFFTTLRDDEFLTRDEYTADSTLQKRIYQKETGDFAISAGALVHFYARTNSYFNAGLSVGAILTNEANPQYLLGGGLLIGRKQRVVLNGGWSFGRVKRLETGLELGGIYAGDGNTPTTMDKWDNGFFFGLSYNF
ncbi:hypothetical protein KFE98_17630 [bacterium SCSIO 12741]|nr:hypothetical protein KFE98_17630 [bacterium SCSIO 12741]